MDSLSLFPLFPIVTFPLCPGLYAEESEGVPVAAHYQEEERGARPARILERNI